MKIERDETKTEKLSIKLRALRDAADKDLECFGAEYEHTEKEMALFELAREIFEDAEKLEGVGMDHTDAMMIALMNMRRTRLLL